MKQEYSLKGISRFKVIFQLIFSKVVYQSNIKRSIFNINCLIAFFAYIIGALICTPFVLENISKLIQTSTSILQALVSIFITFIIYYIFLSLIIALFILVAILAILLLIIFVINLKRKNFDYSFTLKDDAITIIIHQEYEVTINFDIKNIDRIKRSADFYFIEYNISNQKSVLPLPKNSSEEIISAIINGLK